MTQALFRLACGAAAAALALWLWPMPALRAAEQAVVLPAPALDPPAPAGLQTAVLAGGCFWGVQGVFQHTAGVVSAVSGYAGGSASTANYTAVTTGTSGHAEAVKVTYDPQRISYGRLLQIFFSVVHDPTELDRQGPDVGPQYRSAIFTTSETQQAVAKAYIAQLTAAKAYDKPIVTTVASLPGFFVAEDYHQNYLTLHPRQPYIVFNDLPKIANLKELFAENYLDKPTLVSRDQMAH